MRARLVVLAQQVVHAAVHVNPARVRVDDVAGRVAARGNVGYRRCTVAKVTTNPTCWV